MSRPGPWRPQPDPRSQLTADRLALALESVGFDVGRAFPQLGGAVDHTGLPVIELGQVTPHVAAGLTTVLEQAAQHGATLPSTDP